MLKSSKQRPDPLRFRVNQLIQYIMNVPISRFAGTSYISSTLPPDLSHLAGKAIIGGDTNDDLVLPHEIGHILMNNGNHHSSLLNLMIDGEIKIKSGLGASKRLTGEQQGVMQGSIYAQ